jgi:predicted transcriptional regulator
MTTLTLRLEEDLVHRLAERAERHGISVEEEAHGMIADALRKDWATFWERADRIQLRLRGRHFPDSAELIREDRER